MSDIPAEPALYLGLISGTSADAIDVALASFTGTPRLLTGRALAYPPALRTQVLDLARSTAALDLDALGALDVALGHAFAEAAATLLDHAGVPATAVRAIGLHGQTIRHRPTGAHPFTLQLGDPNVIAERTGILTVADFRRRDVAAGGQGAPLVPAFHAALLRDPRETRAALNLGGIANLTLLPAGADAPVTGFDTGPANCLLDAWAVRHLGTACDLDGRWAATGTVDHDLLADLLAEPYFALPPPKSTGRELFNLDWLERHLAGRAPAPADVQATLVALTACSIATAVRAQAGALRELLVCGGGVHNPVLMRALAAALAPLPVHSTAEHGIDPDHVEAMAFAWLAACRLDGMPGNLPSVTGAAGPRVLGALYAGF